MNPEAVAEAYHAFEQGSGVAPLTAAAISNQTIQESMRLLLLVRAYQVRRYKAVENQGAQGLGGSSCSGCFTCFTCAWLSRKEAACSGELQRRRRQRAHWCALVEGRVRQLTAPAAEAPARQQTAGRSSVRLWTQREVHSLIPLRQVNGHFMADLDPLGLDQRPMPVELDPALYGFSDKDLDRE